MIRVMITDDHLIVREGLRLILETADDIEVVGEAVDGAECLELVAKLNPQVILMDLQMPRMDGITAIEHLRKDFPEIAIVILTTYNEDDLMIRGLQSGARGYLLKDSSRENLLDAIHAAVKGETLLKPEILARVLAPQTQPKPAATTQTESTLTERELEVLQSAARGERNKEIAYKLGITERTVKAHLQSIYQKYGVDSRAAAVAVAAQKGLLGI
ncbi:response regulator transcription factor [Candidatus Villigracilis affinis]|uniref:response regulator transcription factor n=1 Tax=Candidatus Villigracilis affinis TaxID=3140682 RepID=UPI002A1A58E4|nr:response regulator transcription factor [Anaerolineales bacterium]